MKYNYFGRTDIGIKRSENQDSYGTTQTDWGSIFVLSDGFGHTEGGKFASQTTIDLLISNYSKEKPSNIKEFLHDSFEEINRYIYFKRISIYENPMMGSTVVALILENETAHIGHIGDSRAYLLRNKKLTKLTKDHSYIQFLIDKGKLSPESTLINDKRHILKKCLGTNQPTGFDYQRNDVKQADKYLLCCDGLWGALTDERITQICAKYEPEIATKKLIKTAILNGGTDNITVQIVSFD